MDVAKELPYCVPCRRTIQTLLKQHLHSKLHKTKTAAYLTSHLALFKKQFELREERIVSFCPFCEAKLRSAAGVQAHYQSIGHLKKLDAFCYRYRCDFDRVFRSSLDAIMAETQALKVVTQDGAQQEAVKDKIALGSQHAAQDRETRAQASIAQGKHEGQHVWGDGIVKVRKAECVAGRVGELVQEERGRTLQAVQTTSVCGMARHSDTAYTSGAGLDRIKRVKWARSVGNVHTTAVPPWMVDSEIEYKQQNKLSHQSVHTAPDSASARKDDIFAKLAQETEYTSDWLPNFGGVWQAGPRSKTKRDFINQIRGNVKSRIENNRTPDTLARHPKSDINRDFASAAILPAINQSYSTPSQTSGESAMDRRKAQLMLQKQRLRAKIAASKSDSK